MPRHDATRSMSLTSQESFAAVIIADMVAEVPTQIDHLEREDGGRNSIRSVKTEVNHGFDGTTDPVPPAVVNVDAMETVNLGPARVNGTDISKGVILNAQFGQVNSKGDHPEVGKAIEMNNARPLKASDAKKESKAEAAPDFGRMSVPRKIAFVFSFLPSIMFVLCFAVILPCEKKLPCIQEMWSKSLNDTEVTSGLKVSSDRLFYSFISGGDGAGGLVSLDLKSGDQYWKTALEYEPHLVGCDKLVENASVACLVSQPSGAIQLFSSSAGKPNAPIEQTKSVDGSPSVPVILPDCHGNGISEVGVAVSSKEIKILNEGIVLSTVNVDGCDSKPQKLTAWTRADGRTDLVFVCQKETKDQLVRMSQSTWCTYKKKNTGIGEVTALPTGDRLSLDQSILQPTPNGLAVWAEDEVTLFGLDGQKNWTVSSHPHTSKNRFLVHGKFQEFGSQQIVLFSSDISSRLQITMLDFETGETTWNKSISNAEVLDVSVMSGEKKDFALIFMRKMERDLKIEAVTHLSEVPSTLVSLLSEEGVVAQTSPSTLVEEITFLELGGNFYQTVDESRVAYAEGESYKTSLTVSPMVDKNIAVIVLKRSKSLFPQTQMRSIRVGNWDISLTENRQCVWKS